MKEKKSRSKLSGRGLRLGGTTQVRTGLIATRKVSGCREATLLGGERQRWELDTS